MRRVLGLLALLSGVACGPREAAPTAPTSPPASNGSSTYTLSGTIAAINGGRPLGGVTITAAGVSSVTDASGRYSLSLPASTPAPNFTIAGGALLHTGSLRDGGSRTVDIAIFGPGFDVPFFQALAHDGHDAPNALRALRHATSNPLFYVRTVDSSGAPIDAGVLQTFLDVLATYTGKFSGGRYRAIVETGAPDRVNEIGRIVVRWERSAGGNCGDTIGFDDPLAIHFAYDRPECSCGSLKVRPRAMKHELGHVMGLNHTGSPDDLMYPVILTCDADPTAQELEYADYMYQRPVGNLYPDANPATSAY